MMPTLALLDADYFIINIARHCDTDGIEDLEHLVDYYVKEWTPPGCDSTLLAFSDSRKKYYRKKFYPMYKENREGMEKPECLPRVRAYCERAYECITVESLEADDILGVYCSAGTAVGVSIDKDMRSVPGWHWNPHKEKAPVRLSRDAADYFFHVQWIVGDPVDGFKGVWRVGPKKAEALLDSTHPDNHTAAVMAMYERKGYDYAYCKAMAVCSRILRSDEVENSFEPILFDPWSRCNSSRAKEGTR